MITLAAFKAAFPEFVEAGDTLIGTWLAFAANEIDAELYSHTTDQAHGLLTAHYLACAPSGQMARLASDKSQTTYGVRYLTLQASASVGLRTF